MKIIKPIGIQRTGTTYMRELIRENFFDVGLLTNHLGWKHGDILGHNLSKTIFRRERHKYSETEIEVCRQAIRERDVKLVVMIKDPYMWYESIIAWAKRSWKFNRNPSLEFLYNNFNKHYADKKDFFLYGKNSVYDDIIIVRYEDLLLSLEKQLGRIAAKFGLEQKPTLKNPDKVQQSGKFGAEEKAYYLKGVPKTDERILARITELVDWNLMEFYNYTPRF